MLKKVFLFALVALMFFAVACTSTEITDEKILSSESGTRIAQGKYVYEKPSLGQAKELVYNLSSKTWVENDVDTLNYGSFKSEKGSKTIPWSGNVSELAKADGTLRFYFMAGEETKVDGVGEKIGDSCLVVFPNGETMLIDANSSVGNPGYAGTLVTNLKKLGVSKLDYVVFSHIHSDHYGCFTKVGGVADSFEIGTVYLNGMKGHGGYPTIEQAVARTNGTIQVIQEGDVLEIGGVRIDILNPIAGSGLETYPAKTEGINNSSLCMMFNYGDFKAFFVGDLYYSGMKDVTDRYGDRLDADVLKIPHHGHSETSLYKGFAEAVTPEVAVISSGCSFNSSVFELYSSVGAKMVNDFMYGYIILASDGKNLYQKTSRQNVSEYYNKYYDASWKPTGAPQYKITDYATGPFVDVSDLDQLLYALNNKEKNIRLMADIDLGEAGYNNQKPLKLKMTDVVLDMNGHTISGCTGMAKNIENKAQTSVCNLILNGGRFTLYNGTFETVSGCGYAFAINTEKVTNPLDAPDIVLDGIKIPGGGIEAFGSTIVIRNCEFEQSNTCNQNWATMCFHNCDVVLESGSFSNHSLIDYKRYLKLIYSNVLIRNWVQFDGTLLYSVEDSWFRVEKTSN